MSVSLVLGSREVSVGPAVVSLQGEPEKQRVVPCLLMKQGFASKSESVNGFASDESFNESSTTDERGEEEDDDDDNDDEDDGTLASMGSLEESLPIKRGLSNFFAGKSKSFANLSEVTTVTDLAKPENPFNKRKRTLMIARSRARRPFHTSLSLASVPALASNENDDDDDHL